MLNRLHSRRPGRRAQRGDIMLVTMVFLLVCLLGLLGSMRDTIVDTNMVGNNLARQKDVQVADIALQIVRDQIMTNFTGAPLEQTPGIVNKAWWRDMPSTVGPTPPDAAYWKTCLGNGNVTARCGAFPLTVNGAAIPYTALALVEPTGRQDPYGCAIGMDTFQALFYAVYVHVQETAGATNINTETVYKVCAAKT